MHIIPGIETREQYDFIIYILHFIYLSPAIYLVIDLFISRYLYLDINVS